MQFYIDRRGETAGPFRPDKIVLMIRHGELAGDHLVWLEGAPAPLTVEELLGAQNPAEADSRIFDKLKPKTRPSRWSRDRSWDDVGEAFELLPWMLGLVPGCGCVTTILGSLGGGGLIALLCVGLYVWGTLDVNRRGAQEQRLEQLRKSIALYVDQHPEAGKPNLEQLRQAGILEGADLDLLEKLDVEFHPVGSDSPKDALLFVRRTESMERRYYKGEATQLVIWWPSPDRQFTMVSAPRSPSSKARIVSIKNEPTGKTIAQYETEAFTVHPKWSPDSRAVAVEESFAGGAYRLRLLRLVGDGARELPLPAEIEPEVLLPLAGRQGTPRWCSNHVTAERWLGSDRLAVESFGNVSLVGEDRQVLGSISARHRFVLGLNEGGATILERERVSFFES
jgi:hypothetical protein